MDAKKGAVAREMFMKALEGFEVEGFVFVGRVSEGAVFESDEGFVVVKPIVKKDTFDFDDALAEYEEKLVKAKEKEEAKAKKVAKAKADKEKAE